MMRFALLFFTLFISCSVQAEYRVFLLRIEKIANPEEFRILPSNLDPQQYRGYYDVKDDEQVYYVDTWMCFERTSTFKKYCDSPRGLASDETAP